MTGWLTRLRDRPIAEHERRSALTAVAVLLTATTLLLTLTRPAPHHPSTTTRPLPGNTPTTRRPAGPPRVGTSLALSAQVVRASRAFLAGYLAYIYGHAPASQIKGATSALVRSLHARPPRVSPGMRTRDPRVLSLHAIPAPPGRLGVSALVNDGGLISYPVGLLLLAPHGGGLLVNALERD